MAITYRTTQYGGANTPLTNAQIDENFNYIWTNARATVTDDNTTNSNYYLTLSSGVSGNYNTAYISSNKLTFNPSSGTLSATNINSLSDERFKSDLSQIQNSLQKVTRLTGYTFNLVESNQPSAGLIAQQVKEVLPEAVGGSEEKLTLNYGAVLGLVVEAIKQLNDKVDVLQKQLNDK